MSDPVVSNPEKHALFADVRSVAPEIDRGFALVADIVAYSKLSGAEKRHAVDALHRALKASRVYQEAKTQREVTGISTGDGFILVFKSGGLRTLECGIYLRDWRAEELPPLRLGLHHGLIDAALDVNGQDNLLGEGIDYAVRAMNAAEPGQFLATEAAIGLLRGEGLGAKEARYHTKASLKHGERMALWEIGPFRRRPGLLNREVRIRLDALVLLVLSLVALGAALGEFLAHRGR